MAWLQPRTPHGGAGRARAAAPSWHPSPTRGAHRSPRLLAGKPLNWAPGQAAVRDLVLLRQERVRAARPQARLALRARAQPPTASPGGHPAPQGPSLPPRSPHRPGLLGSGGGIRPRSENFAKDGNSPRRERASARNREGASVKLPRVGRRRGGAHLLLSRALRSRLRAAAAPPQSRRRRPRLPAHMPRPRSNPARAGRGAGRGTPPAAGRGLAADSGPPGCAPGRRPQSWAESSVPAGRRPPRARPLSALCPLPSAAAVSLPSAVRPRIRPDAAPARRPARRLRPRAPARSRAGPPRLTAAPSLRPGPPLRGGCQDPHSHTAVPSRDWEPGARGCEATPEPRRRKREGDSGPGEEAGGRVGRWRRREGRRVPSASPQPGPPWHEQLETSGGKGSAKAGGGGVGGGGAD